MVPADDLRKQDRVKLSALAASKKWLLGGGLLLLLAMVSGIFLLPRWLDRDHKGEPIATPTITIVPSVSPSPMVSPSPSPSPTIMPTVEPSPTIQPTGITPVPTSVPLQSEIVWGNRNKKQVIFTFDAGSGNQSIGAILDTLAHFQLEGAFFITGSWAEKYSGDMIRIAQGGHAIYNHTYTHPHLTQLTDDQIKSQLSDTDKKIASIVGFDSKPFFRAPYGERDNRVLAVAASQGYRHVYWTIDALDWKEGVTAQQVKDRILQNVQPGTIYLMHVGDAITGQILSEVFQEIINRGYTIAPLRLGIL